MTLAKHFLPRRLLTAVALTVALAHSPAQAESRFERAGDILMMALPAAAGVCAAYQDRTPDFWAGFITNQVVTQAGKQATQGFEFGKRPNGGRFGFPSGHTSAAFYGATNLAQRCFPDKPLWGAVAYGTAALVGASRISAKKHDLTQVVAGALVGYYSNGVRLDLSDGKIGISYSMEF